MKDTSNRRLLLPAQLVEEIVSHCRDEAPLEACGLLAGHGDLAERVYRLKNEASSTSKFLSERSLFAPFKDMRQLKLDLVAIYHSHPMSSANPSLRDREENHYEETIQLIVSLVDETPQIRAWLYGPSILTELPIETSTGKSDSLF